MVERVLHRTARLAAAAVLGMVATLQVAGAASSSTVVSATVPSATSLDASACAPELPDVTELGTVLPGASVVTGDDCAVSFGSSNDSSQLRVSQTDGALRAMHRPPTGPIDTSFDSDGYASLSLDGYDVAALPGGGWIVAGEASGAQGWEFAAQRLTETGATDWYAYRPITGSGDSMVFDVAVDPSGRVLLAGHSGVGNPDFTVMRLQGDGSLDTSFNQAGTPGWNVPVVAPAEQMFKAVALQSDGGIVAAGADEDDGDGKVYRFADDGTVDASFGSGGVVELDFFGETKPHELLVLEDDSMLVAGIAYVGFSFDVFVVKLDRDGAIDTGWGAAGWRFIETNFFVDEFRDDPMQLDYDAARELAWITASTETTELDTTVGLLDVAAGDWVGGFGSGGTVTWDATGSGGDDYGSGVAHAGDGSAYVLSFDDDTSDVHVRRVLADGTFDMRFDGDGTWTSPSPPTNYQYRGKLDVDVDGRVMGLADATMFRFATTTIPDYGGGADWTSAGGAFGACLRQLVGGGVDGTTWAVDGGGDCAATVGDAWNPIAATSAAAGAKVALRATPGTATATLRFGLRVPDGAGAGRYVAPITFDVLAPDAP